MFSWKGDGRSPSLLSPWSQFTQPATQKTLTGNSCRCFAQARRCAARKAKKRAALSADGAFQSKSSFSFVELSVSLFSIFSIPLKESKTPSAKKTKVFPHPPLIHLRQNWHVLINSFSTTNRTPTALKTAKERLLDPARCSSNEWPFNCARKLFRPAPLKKCRILLRQNHPINKGLL